MVNKKRKLDQIEENDDYNEETKILKENNNNNRFNNNDNTDISSCGERVFKNGTILKNVFTNFRMNKQFGYDDLNMYSFFNKNQFMNGMEIIKDKLFKLGDTNIIKNDKEVYLLLCNTVNYKSFSSSTSSTSSTSSSFKEELKSFYDQFYSKFLKDQQQEQLIDFKEFNKWIPIIINSNNIVALQVYINKFNITNDQIKELYLEFNFSVSEKGIFRYYLFKSYESVKMFNYLLSNKLILENKYIIDNNCINFLINKPNLLKIKQIIKLYKIITKINNNSNNNNNNKYNSLVNEINQVLDSDNKYFSKEDLGLSVRELLEKQNELSTYSSLKDFIFKLFKTIYSVNKSNYNSINNNNSLSNFIKKPIEYYFLLDDKNKIKKYLKSNYTTPKRIIESLKEIHSARNLPLTIDRNKECQVISDLALQTNVECQYAHFALIISYVVLFKDNQLEEHLKRSYLLIYNAGYQKKVLQMVNDKESLDYLLKYYKDEFFRDGNENWQFISLDILEYYEKLLLSIDRKMNVKGAPIFDSKIYQLFNSQDNQNISIKTLMKNLTRVSKNENLVYLFNGNKDDILSYYSIHLPVLNQDDQHLSVLLKSIDFKQQVIDLSDIYFADLIRFPNKSIIWLFSNRSGCSKESIIKSLKDLQDKLPQSKNKKTAASNDEIPLKLEIVLENKSTVLVQLKVYQLLNYLSYCNRMNDVFDILNQFPQLLINSNYTDKLNSQLLNYSSYNLGLLIQYCYENQGSNSITLLHQSLSTAAKRGFMSIFINILSNEAQKDQLLKKKSKQNQNSLFESKLLIQLIDDSILFNNLNLSVLLINSIDLTQKESKSLLSKVYKKNIINYN